MFNPRADVLSHFKCEVSVKKKGVRHFRVMAVDEKKLKGLCKICMKRKWCHEAKRYLDVTMCSELKIHGNRKIKDE